ncbi:MAG TPA: hypothetical protein VGB75_05130 [Jatrophihabitans sp.]|uniref:hypothetical protein n=1 Tax=Jatrophihabitans sp. TaxID=1932789 RepID=UPI002EDFB44E
MHLALLSVGSQPAPRAELPGPFASRHTAVDAAGVDAALEALEEGPGRLTADLPRLVIDADLAGLNLVLHRLMRRGLLETLETAVLPREPVPYLSRLGLPADPGDQLRIASSAPARLIGVVKDDSGGVCVDGASMRPWPDEPGEAAGEPWWLRAVVDDQRLADGTVRELRMRRLGPSELEATVRLGRLRQRTCRGRSLQLACDPALVVTDGVGRERPRGKRTFWSEPTLWWLALPLG